MKWICSLLLCFSFTQASGHESFHAKVSILYLDTCQSSLDYAFKGTPEFLYPQFPTYIANIPLNGNKHYLDYDWDSGFRLDVGFQPNYCTYSLAFSWMSFTTVAEDSVKESGEKIVYPTLIHPDRTLENAGIPGARSAERAKGRNSLSLDTYDFFLQSAWTIDHCTKFIPRVGLRVAEIDQALNVDYINITDRNLVDQNESVCVGYRSELEGYGLVMGAKTEFLLGCGFGFHLEASGFLLTTQFTTHHKEEFLGSGLLFVDVKGHQCAPEWGIDVSAGLDWKRQCGAACLVFGVNYEVHEWLQVPQITQFNDNSAVGTSSEYASHLTVHGVAFTGRIAF